MKAAQQYLHFNLTAWIAALFWLATSCNKNSDVKVQTTGSSEIGLTSAKVTGSLYLENSSTSGSCGFCWSKHTSPTLDDYSVQAPFAFGSFESKLSNLDSATTYYVRAFAKTTKMTMYGEELTFKTLRRLDMGSVWTALDVGIGKRNVVNLAGSGTNIYAFFSNQGVYHSSDDGQTWSAFSNGLGQIQWGKLLCVNGAIFLWSGNTLFRSGMNSPNWQMVIYTGLAAGIAVIGNNMIVSDVYGSIFASPDGGITWSPQGSSGLPNNIYIYEVNSVGNRLLLATSNGVISCDYNNGTLNFDSNTLQSSVTRNLTVHGVELYASTDAGLYLSADQGANWSLQRPNNQYGAELFFSGSNVYYFNGGNVYFSQDKCVHLSDMGGLPDVACTLTLNDKYIFTAAMNYNANTYQIFRLSIY